MAVWCVPKRRKPNSQNDRRESRAMKYIVGVTGSTAGRRKGGVMREACAWQNDAHGWPNAEGRETLSCLPLYDEATTDQNLHSLPRSLAEK